MKDKDKLIGIKCRCYINSKYYARQVNKNGDFRGYVPCPIHEVDNLDKKQCQNCSNYGWRKCGIDEEFCMPEDVCDKFDLKEQGQ
ncbi:MAG TPA: hypothetical protein ENI23_04415 [bacterium]|nr:hypothetical protein [bacterium]